MNREELSNIINYEGPVFRTISTDRKLTFVEGQIIDNLGNCWSTQYGEFTVENDREFEYFFRCNNNVKGHEVDYENVELCEGIGAIDCERECEVLVSNNQKFKVVYVSNDDDFKEMGYYEVELEVVND